MVAPRFHKHHDLLHHDYLCVWSVFAMYETLALPLDSFTDPTRIRTLPFVIKANELYIHMLQNVLHRVLFSCQGDRISFRFALVHQRVGNITDEVHVDSEAEAEIKIIRVVSIERRRLAQTSQVHEQFGIKSFRQW